METEERQGGELPRQLKAIAEHLGAVQEAVARQARDVAGLAEAMEEHQDFLRAWRDLMRAQLTRAKAENEDEQA